MQCLGCGRRNPLLRTLSISLTRVFWYGRLPTGKKKLSQAGKRTIVLVITRSANKLHFNSFEEKSTLLGIAGCDIII